MSNDPKALSVIFIFNLETEKVALMPPKSPCLSSNVADTIQRQRHQILNRIPHHSSNDNETLSSSSPEQSRNQHIPIVRQYSRSHFIPTRQHHTKIDTDDINNHHFTSSRTPIDFQKKIHDIYVLPVSPALSSSSSTTNTDEIIKTSSNTMPIRSRRHLSSSANIHHDSTYRGIKNDCFADSPQPKTRTLPRSYVSTLRRVQPPSQPPPSPPTISQLDVNDHNKSSFQHRLSTEDLNPNKTAFRFNTIEENQVKKTLPPPVPCRAQKPSVLPIGFEEIIKQSDKIGFRLMTESSPQNDYSEHAWPNPPDSMSTSQISGPLSIPYDHLMPTVIMHQNSTTNFFPQYRHNEHSMLTESET